MKDGARYLILALATVISVGSPAAAALCFFPLWQSKGGGAALSGFALFLLVICAIPLFRVLKKLLSTPSAPIVWLLIFVFFFLFEKIAGEVTVVALVGTISNLIGAILFKIAKIKRADK